MNEQVVEHPDRPRRRYQISGLVLVDCEIVGDLVTFASWDGTEENFDRMQSALIAHLAHQNGWEIDRVRLCITNFIHCWGEDGASNE